jgi:DNA-binding NtrC family response regulator
MDEACILIVDDDPDVRQAAALALRPYFTRCDEAASPDEATGLMIDRRYGAVVLDMNFLAGERSGGAGITALTNIRAVDPSLGIVFITAYGGVTLAVEAMKRGGDDFVPKPWRNAQLVAAVRDVVALTRSRRIEPTLDAVERSAIAQALERHDGNIARAAAALGLTRQALYRRLAKDG